MRRSMQLAVTVLAAAGMTASALGQAANSTLPPTQPTSLPAGNALPAPIAGTPIAGEQTSKPNHAQVTFINGQLDVRADNSSLNQILRSIARKTGLKITGGVADDRVFGNYGPASPSSVLATLLDGTGTNILLLEGNATTPPALVLTPRGGGPTPPSPDSSAYAAFDDTTEVSPAPAQRTQQTPPQQPRSQAPSTSAPQSVPQPLNNVNGSPSNTSPTASTFPTTHSVPIDTVPAPSTTPSTSGIVDSPNPPPPGSTTGTAPNGTLTPEQVYQQLLKQQQQSNQSPTSSTPQ